MNNLEMNRAKEKLEKKHFRGWGFHAVLESYYVSKIKVFLNLLKF